jgi:hypothetical protein
MPDERRGRGLGVEQRLDLVAEVLVGRHPHGLGRARPLQPAAEDDVPPVGLPVAHGPPARAGDDRVGAADPEPVVQPGHDVEVDREVRALEVGVVEGEVGEGRRDRR